VTGTMDALRPLVCGAAAVGLVAAAGSPAIADGKKAYSTTTAPTPAIAVPPLSKLPSDKPAAKRAALLKRWSTQAAHGNANAQLKLGRIYRWSKNTKANAHKALHWLRAAARANIPAAHYQLGLLYMAGIAGRPPNLVEAYAHFKIASDGGDVRATALVFYIGVRMTANELRRAHERIADIHRFEIDTARHAIGTDNDDDDKPAAAKTATTVKPAAAPAK
jgi:TPR repeat protein